MKIKSFIIILLSFFVMENIYAQNNEKAAAKIDKKVSAIIADSSSYQKLMPKYEQDEVIPDGGYHLFGYLKKDKLVKVNESVGLSYAYQVTEYYYSKGELIMVHEQEYSFPYDEATATFDYEAVSLTYEARFYFNDNELIHTKKEGKKVFPDELLFDSNTKGGVLMDNANKWKTLFSAEN